MKIAVLFSVVIFVVLLLWSRKKQLYVHSISIDSSNCLKGIMAITVVLHHLSQSAPDFHILSPFRSFGSIAVGYFFFISGYGLMSSYQAKGRRYLTGFVEKRIYKLIVPFVFAIILFQVLRGFQNFDLLGDLKTGHVDGVLPHSWYIFCAMLFYFIFYLAFRISFSMKKNLLACLLLTVSLMITFILLHWPGYWIVSLALFPAGLYYKYYEKGWLTKGYKLVMKSILGLGMLLLILLTILHFIDCGYGNHFLSVMTNMAAPLIFIIPISLTDLHNTFLKKLGNISYEVYLVHGVVMEGLRSPHLYLENDWLYLLGTFVITILLAWSIKMLIQKVTPTV